MNGTKAAGLDHGSREITIAPGGRTGRHHPNPAVDGIIRGANLGSRRW